MLLLLRKLCHVPMVPSTYVQLRYDDAAVVAQFWSAASQ